MKEGNKTHSHSFIRIWFVLKNVVSSHSSRSFVQRIFKIKFRSAIVNRTNEIQFDNEKKIGILVENREKIMQIVFGG